MKLALNRFLEALRRCKEAAGRVWSQLLNLHSLPVRRIIRRSTFWIRHVSIFCRPERSPPFLLWMYYPSRLDRFLVSKRGAGHASEPNRYAPEKFVFLWPVGLRNWYLGFGLFLSASMFYEGECWAGAITFLWVTFLYPMMAYIWFRKPVLWSLWGAWPPQFEEYYGVESIHIDGTKTQSQNDCYISIKILGLLDFLPRLPVTSPRSGISTTFAKLALGNHFGSTSNDIWYDRGFWRWLFLRCGPIVAGQVIIIFISLYFLFQSPMDLSLLTQTAVIWVPMAALMLYQAVGSFERECKLSIDEMKMLPFVGGEKEVPFLYQKLPELKLKLVLTISGIGLIPTLLAAFIRLNR